MNPLELHRQKHSEVLHEYSVVQHVSQSAGTYINQPQGRSNGSDNSVQSKIKNIH